MNSPSPAYAEKFLEHLRENGRNPSTIKRYHSDINKFLSWLQIYKGSNPIQDLQLLPVQDYEEYIKYLEKRNLSDATIKRLITVLNRLLKYLGIEPIHHLRESSKNRPLRQLTENDFVSPYEFNLLAESMRSTSDLNKKAAREFLIKRNLIIVSLMRFFGLTPAEISAIEMKDLNLSQGILIVYGQSRTRKATIDRKHLEYISDYLNTIDNLKRPRIRSLDPLFVAFNNTSYSFQFDYAISKPKRLSERAIQKMLKDEVQRANLRKLSATNLRNACIIDHLLKQDPDIDVISTFGLSDAFSLRRYKIYLGEMSQKTCTKIKSF